jgi:AcrR family transcriptional regulator
MVGGGRLARAAGRDLPLFRRVGTVPSGKRERTKAANREAILQAARAVFGEVGYGAASVRDIVRRTELAAGTFYNYFPDKESIFRALMEEIAGEARRRVRTARRAATTPRAFVEDGYRAYFEYIAEDPANHALIARNAGTLRALSEDGQVPLGTGELADDLRGAIAEGHVPPVDVEYASHAMMAVGLELGLRLLERDPPDVEGATRFAAALVLGGLEQAGRAVQDQMNGHERSETSSSRTL